MNQPLTDEELAFLRTRGFDERGFARRQALVRAKALSAESVIFRGPLEPPRPGDIDELPALATAQGKALAAQGAQLLTAGKVARLVLAGGKATRFGGGVKGAVDVLPGESFLGLLLRDAREAARRHGKPVPFVIMSSHGSTELIRDHLEARGLWGPDILVFEQGLSVRLTPEGEIFREADGSPSYYPPGHGDFFRAFRESGTLAKLRGAGVEHLFFSNVDNLGASLDGRLLGYHLQKGADFTVEVTARQGADVAGAPVRGDGRMRLLEGFRFPKDVDPLRYPDVSINSYWFRLNAKALDLLGGEIPLEAYLTTKKVEGRPALQFEMVTGEATEALYPSGEPVLKAAYVRIPRAGPPGHFYDGRFYPVKERAHLDDVSKALAWTRLREAFDARFPGAPGPLAFFAAAGRVNLLGEHTDYAEGLALPAAINRRIRGAFQAVPGERTVRLASRQFEAEVELSLDALPELPRGDWRRYAVSALKVLAAHAAKQGARLTGLRGVIDSDLPVGSGMSSSAALVLLVLKAAAALSGVGLAPLTLAQLAQAAEWDSGIKTGLLDQLAIVFGRKGQVSLLDTRALTSTPVPVDLKGHVFVIAFTRPRALVGSAYEQRRAEVERAAERFRQVSADPGIRTLRDVTPALFETHQGALPEPLRKRARHVVFENARVQEAVDALSRGEVERFKELMGKTHRSLRDDYEVSSPELDAMVEAAAEYGKQAGVSVGARMMGGGFGGPVLLLVPGEHVERAKHAIAERYRARTGSEGAFWDVTLEDGLEAVGPEGVP